MPLIIVSMVLATAILLILLFRVCNGCAPMPDPRPGVRVNPGLSPVAAAYLVEVRPQSE